MLEKLSKYQNILKQFNMIIDFYKTVTIHYLSQVTRHFLSKYQNLHHCEQ